MAKEYTRVCFDCKTTISYSSYKTFWKAEKNNSTCRGCFYKSLVGHNVSLETRVKIGKSNSISLLGNVPSNKGKQMSEEQRVKLSKIHTGMKHGEETKKKFRIRRLDRLKKLGIGTAVDIGSKEFLNEYNKENKLNLNPRRFMEIGYDADGYDKINHIWLEFDTPYHKFPTQKEKDIVRQNNIIKHFEQMGTPLNKFVRVSADKTGKVIEIKTVYKGGL